LFILKILLFTNEACIAQLACQQKHQAGIPPPDSVAPESGNSREPPGMNAAIAQARPDAPYP
jgi:hypothetical protein